MGTRWTTSPARTCPRWPAPRTRSASRPSTPACMCPAADWKTSRRASWAPTGRSPTARTRRLSAGSRSSTCPHARRRWNGLPSSPSPAAARRKSGRSGSTPNSTRCSARHRAGGHVPAKPDGKRPAAPGQDLPRPQPDHAGVRPELPVHPAIETRLGSSAVASRCAAARAHEAALALTQNAAERAYLVTTLAAQRPGHPDGVADGQGQAGGDGQVDGDGGVDGDDQVVGDGGVAGGGETGTGREAAGNGYPHAARAQRGERQGDGAEEARRQHREEAPE